MPAIWLKARSHTQLVSNIIQLNFAPLFEKSVRHGTTEKILNPNISNKLNSSLQFLSYYIEMSVDNFSSFNINRWHVCKDIDPKFFLLVCKKLNKNILNKVINVCENRF